MQIDDRIFCPGSERKILSCIYPFLFLLLDIFLCELMYSVSFYINRFIRFDRARIFTRAAADAKFLSHLGYNKTPFKRNHMNRFGRAMFRARPAIGFLYVDNTILLYKIGLSDLGQLLIFQI